MNPANQPLPPAAGVRLLKPIEFDATTEELLHNAFDSWKEGVVVQHYLRFEYFEKLVTESVLRLANYRGHPKENLYPDGNRKASSTFNSKLAESLGNSPEKLFKIQESSSSNLQGWIQCWYEQRDEGVGMWKKYGDDFKGVCIVSDSIAVKSSIPDDPAITWGRVFYSDTETSLPLFWSTLPLMQKERREFEHEKEFRLLAVRGTEEGGFVKVPVNLGLLIKHVFYGVDFPTDNIPRLKGLHAAYFSRATVSQSKVKK